MEEKVLASAVERVGKESWGVEKVNSQERRRLLYAQKGRFSKGARVWVGTLDEVLRKARNC